VLYRFDQCMMFLKNMINVTCIVVTQYGELQSYFPWKLGVGQNITKRHFVSVLINKCCDDVCILTVSSHRILSECQRDHNIKWGYSPRKTKPYMENVMVMQHAELTKHWSILCIVLGVTFTFICAVTKTWDQQFIVSVSDDPTDLILGLLVH
jgi:hypothetical protein